MLPNATQDQIIATAFNRHHPINNEGGALSDEIRFNYVVDRVHTTTFMGLTMSCAQWRDAAVSYWHKAVSVRTRDWRLIVTGAKRRNVELYDMKASPDPVRYLAGERPSVVERLLRLIPQR